MKFHLKCHYNNHELIANIFCIINIVALLPVYAELFPEQSTDPSSANGDNNDRMDNTQRRTNHTVFREKIAFLCTPGGYNIINFTLCLLKYLKYRNY